MTRSVLLHFLGRVYVRTVRLRRRRKAAQWLELKSSKPLFWTGREALYRQDADHGWPS